MIEQIQKKLILTHMGINHWVSNSSNTNSFDLDNVYQGVKTDCIDVNTVINSNVINNEVDNTAESNSFASESNTSESNVVSVIEYDTKLNHQSLNQSKFVQDDSTKNNHIGLVDGIVDEVLSIPEIIIEPFKIQGVYYNDWVLLIDVRKLNEAENKLWQSICSVFQTQSSELSFPICEGMDSLDIAKATLSGFFYKLGKVTTGAKIIKLNDCLDKSLYSNHYASIEKTSPDLESFSLSALIANPIKKKELWQLLNK